MILNANERTFAPFSLTRLLTTCFGRVMVKTSVSIDLPNPTAKISNFREKLSIQNYGHEFSTRFKMVARRDELDGGKSLPTEKLVAAILI